MIYKVFIIYIPLCVCVFLITIILNEFAFSTKSHICFASWN